MMNLQRVSIGCPARMMLNCCKCGGRFRDKELYADLDGAPFSAFYCEPCAETVAPGQVDGIHTFAQHN